MELRRGGIGRLAALAIGVGSAAGAQPAMAAVAHAVEPGESLWSISAANGISVASMAAFNGLSEDAGLLAGQTVQVPSLEDGAAPAAASEPAMSPSATAPAYGLATVTGPYGSVQLDPAAAAAFEAMRADSLAQLGIDLFPDGSLSGYRSYEQQAYLYDLFLSGVGAPANPPGTSSHEIGIAIDLADPAMRSVVDQLGPAYGWYGISSEWWHIEYSG